MARCKSCGKVNRDGAHFCQDCGSSFDGPAGPAGAGPAGKDRGRAAERAGGGNGVAVGGAAANKLAAGDAVAAPAAVPAASLECPACGAGNAAGVIFCKQCGTALAGSPASPPGRISCVQCGQPTPAGFTFCQHCGHRIAGDREPAARPPGRMSRSEIPSAELPPPAVPRAAAPAQAAVHLAGVPASPSAGQAASANAPAHAPAAVSPEPGKPLTGRPGSGTLRGRLIVMRRDGSDGEVITLSGELFDIGRVAPGKTFPDDPFLAARHVRFFMSGGGVRVRPLDQVNGVYIQLREPYELQAGDVFYIGRELIRYEPLAPEERDPAPAIEHGVRIFGSTPRESWARLRQLTTAALVRDVWHLSRAEVLLGREEGDIVFPDDEFMSRRHALITRVGGRVRLEDQHSSNGTYVRLRGDRDVLPNDVLRVGDQVLRFEP